MKIIRVLEFVIVLLILGFEERILLGQQAPPGWNFCTDPSYFIRACEAFPYSQRYAYNIGYVGQICGAHTVAYGGEDGFVYPIKDGGPNGGGYPRPPNGAPAAQDAWDQCFTVNKHQNDWPFMGLHCDTAPVIGGTLVYHPITWSQLPEGGQKGHWGIVYGCSGPPPPIATPSATATPGGATPTKVKTATPRPGDCCPRASVCRDLPPCSELSKTVTRVPTNEPPPVPSPTRRPVPPSPIPTVKRTASPPPATATAVSTIVPPVPVVSPTPSGSCFMCGCRSGKS